ncbi:MAG: hypothetical protein SGILL_009576, partial [Bacillariaceae sp.]
MPTGEQVNFCAHAAMGAAHEIHRQNSNCEKRSGDTDGQDTIVFTVADPDENDTIGESTEYRAEVDGNDTVALQMKTIYEQTSMSQPSLLSEMLKEHCGVDEEHILRTTESLAESSPLCHVSIARPKTLVPLQSTRLLHQAVAPKLAKKFQDDCRSLDDTTGLYLYAQSQDEDGAWECRQFPR